MSDFQDIEDLCVAHAGRDPIKDRLNCLFGH